MATYYTTLFDRLGRLFAHHAALTTFKGTLDTQLTSTIGEWSGYDANQIAPLTSRHDARKAALNGLSADLIESGGRCLLETTDANYTLRVYSVSGALEELVRQMVADSESVDRSTVTIGSVSAGASNYGDGTLLLSATAPKVDRFGNRHGNAQVETIHSETITARCEADALNRLIAESAERFTVYGQRAEPVSSEDWPAGSGCRITVNAASPRADAGQTPGANVLTNGDFEDFVSDTPNHWTVNSGTAGTHILAAGSGYSGSDALKFVGDGSTAVNLSQALQSTVGTRGVVNSDRPYSISFWAKYATAAPTASLVVEVANASGTVYESGNIGRAMQLTATSGSLTTSWQLFSAVCFAPPEIEPGSKVVVRSSGNIANTAEVFVDDLTVAEMYPLGPGLGYAQVIPGATPFRIGDSFTRAFSNDEAGQVQREMDRFFGLRRLGVMLPSDGSGSETVADSVIA